MEQTTSYGISTKVAVPYEEALRRLDPVAALELTGNRRVLPIAEEVKGRLERVVQAVQRTSS